MGKPNKICISYPTINMQKTGEKIKQLRKERGYKVTEIAAFMGFNEPQAVYKWQRGESLPSVDNLFALSILFGVSIDELIVSDNVADNSVFKGFVYGIIYPKEKQAASKSTFIFPDILSELFFDE